MTSVKNQGEDKKKSESNENFMQNKNSEVKTDPGLKIRDTSPITDKDAVFEVPKNEKKDRIFSSKDIILGFINLVTIILLIVFLVKLPEKSTDLKKLKVEQLKGESASLLPISEITAARDKANEIESLFLDQSGIVGFVDEIEKLKVEGSSIQKVSFASQKPIKDKTGFSGVPVVIEMRGSWEAIGTDLQKIESLPYLFRAASVDAATIPDNPGVIDFKYGGFLYVNDELGKN